MRDIIRYYINEKRKEDKDEACGKESENIVMYAAI